MKTSNPGTQVASLLALADELRYQMRHGCLSMDEAVDRLAEAFGRSLTFVTTRIIGERAACLPAARREG